MCKPRKAQTMESSHQRCTTTSPRRSQRPDRNRVWIRTTPRPAREDDPVARLELFLAHPIPRRADPVRVPPRTRLLSHHPLERFDQLSKTSLACMRARRQRRRTSLWSFAAWRWPRQTAQLSRRDEPDWRVKVADDHGVITRRPSLFLYFLLVHH